MSEDTNKILEELVSLDRNRKFWLRISVFICIAVIFMISQWDNIMISHTGWIFACVAMIISSCWWYWIMRLVRISLHQRKREAEIMEKVVKDIRTIKDRIKTLDVTE